MPPRTGLRLLLFISLCSTVTSAGVAEVERRENSFSLPKCSNVVKQHRALSLCVTVTSRDVSLTRHSEQVHSALVLRNSHGNRFCFLHFDCKSNTDGGTSQYGFHRKLTFFYSENILKKRNTLKIFFDSFRFFGIFRNPTNRNPYIKFEFRILTGSIYNSLKLHKIPNS